MVYLFILLVGPETKREMHVSNDKPDEPLPVSA